jgi:hypothetical protein
MSVIALTAFVGLWLAGFFVFFFIHQTMTGSGRERDALMPLDEEKFTTAKSGKHS